MSSYDITFCDRDCKNYKCNKNMVQMLLIGHTKVGIPFKQWSIENFKDCKDFKEIENE